MSKIRMARKALSAAMRMTKNGAKELNRDVGRGFAVGAYANGGAELIKETRDGKEGVDGGKVLGKFVKGGIVGGVMGGGAGMGVRTAVRGGKAIAKAAKRTNNAEPVSAKRPPVGSKARENNKRQDATTKAYDDAYAELEQKGLPDDVIRRRLRDRGL